VIPHVAEATAREHLTAGLDEARGALDGDDRTFRTDDLREVGRREARTGADVEHLRAVADAGAPPALEHGRPPHAMLQAEPFQLLVVRAQEVAALAGRHSHCALRSR
jgi:hypothetical protein